MGVAIPSGAGTPVNLPDSLGSFLLASAAAAFCSASALANCSSLATCSSVGACICG